MPAIDIEFIRKEARIFYAYAQRVGAADVTMNDVESEFCMAATQAARLFNADNGGASWPTYLGHACKHAFIDMMRKRSARRRNLPTISLDALKGTKDEPRYDHPFEGFMDIKAVIADMDKTSLDILREHVSPSPEVNNLALAFEADTRPDSRITNGAAITNRAIAKVLGVHFNTVDRRHRKMVRKFKKVLDSN